MLKWVRRASMAGAVIVVTTLAAACGGTTVEGNPRGDGSAPIVTTTTAAPTTTTTTTTSATPSTTTTPSTAPAVDPSEYAGAVSGSWYFTTPSARFQCGILTGGAQSVAGCQGDIPPDAPQVEGSGAPGLLVAPNTIEVESGAPGRFTSSGDPKYYNFDGPTTELPYDAPLTAGGYTCLVDEQTGVTCTDAAGSGFTVSGSAYRVF